ncbi:MAG: phosphoribosylanthranilate isomerase [Dyella sp.]
MNILSRTRIKFCGMTRVQDAQHAAHLGVDAIGLIFTARSKRRVELAQAQAIVAALPPFVSTVALFMDDEAEQVRAVCDALKPSLLQFHGQESETWCQQFGYSYLKALAMGEGTAGLGQLGGYPSAAGLLLDGHGLGQPGGEGHSFDWSLMPRDFRQPLILAGGLDASNVAQAIRIARPWAVDVSSGIESAPGIKDHAVMRAFVAAVREVSSC